MTIEDIKAATGIANANCSTCVHLGSDGDGPEYNGNWPVCNKFDRMGYLRSFPFKKEMNCWFPDFWQSKFTAEVGNATDDELNRACDNFRAAIGEKRTAE